MTSYASLLREGTDALLSAGLEDAAFDARMLLFLACGLEHSSFLLRKELAAPPEAQARFRALILQRSAHTPLQYLLENQVFLGREFAVGKGVLIPRPETEELTERCIDRIRADGLRTVFDLCAGSGCIGVSIALACPETQVYLFEKDASALSYLRRNVPSAAADRIRVIEADVLEGCPAGLPQPDVIISNPPYIPSAEIASLQQEVRQEPVIALDGGADGLMFYRAIAQHWMPMARKGGFAAFECAEDQISPLTAFFESYGQVAGFPDLFGNDRFVFVVI